MPDLFGMDGDEDASMSDKSWETMSDRPGENGAGPELDEMDGMDGVVKQDTVFFLAPDGEVLEFESGSARLAAFQAVGVLPPGGTDFDEYIDYHEDTESAMDVEEVDPPDSPVVKAVKGSSLSHDLEEQPTAGPSSPRVNRLAGDALAEDERWQRFEMLESAPADHHFVGEQRGAAPAKSYSSRINKEHRALRSSLPGQSLSRGCFRY